MGRSTSTRPAYARTLHAVLLLRSIWIHLMLQTLVSQQRPQATAPLTSHFLRTVQHSNMGLQQYQIVALMRASTRHFSQCSSGSSIQTILRTNRRLLVFSALLRWRSATLQHEQTSIPELCCRRTSQVSSLLKTTMLPDHPKMAYPLMGKAETRYLLMRF